MRQPRGTRSGPGASHTRDLGTCQSGHSPSLWAPSQNLPSHPLQRTKPSFVSPELLCRVGGGEISWLALTLQLSFHSTTYRDPYFPSGFSGQCHKPLEGRSWLCSPSAPGAKSLQVCQSHPQDWSVEIPSLCSRSTEWDPLEKALEICIDQVPPAASEVHAMLVLLLTAAPPVQEGGQALIRSYVG